MTILENKVLNAITDGKKTFKAIHAVMLKEYKGLAMSATRMSLMELEKAGYVSKIDNKYFYSK
jgi:ribosomal protein S25